MTEKDIKFMAKLLQNGATMLDQYCPQCNNILYRLNNKTIFCPICNQEVKIMSDQEFDSIGKQEEGLSSSLSRLEINDVVNLTLKNLLKKLEHVEDLNLMKLILSNIESCLNILNK